MSGEERWAWVVRAWQEYKAKETTSIRGLIESSRAGVDDARAGAAAAQERVAQLQATGAAHLQVTVDRAEAEVRDACRAYPEAAVGATFLLTCNLGRAPRRGLLLSLASGGRRGIRTPSLPIWSEVPITP